MKQHVEPRVIFVIERQFDLVPQKLNDKYQVNQIVI